MHTLKAIFAFNVLSQHAAVPSGEHLHTCKVVRLVRRSVAPSVLAWFACVFAV